jgi:dTDP-glucose 4,6-dehydratase
MVKRILVCGGSGFIGSNFIRYLLERHPDYAVTNLDALTYAGRNGNLDNLEGEPRYRLVEGDICDKTVLDDLFRETAFDLVVNFAAESHVDRSIFNSFAFIQTNINGVHSLIEAVRTHRVRRFVQISTDEVYGDIPDDADEDAALRPSSPYASSKASADLLICAYMRTHRLPAVIVRGANVFGPYQYPEKLIPLATINLITGRKIPVHGTGEQIRNWLHVLDFCSAIDLVMHCASDHAIYNVSDVSRRNIEVLETIATLLGKDLRLHRMHVKDRPGGDARYMPNSGKIRRELGWAPMHSFDRTIGGVTEWYVRNAAWWERILEMQDTWEHYQRQFRAEYF